MGQDVVGWPSWPIRWSPSCSGREITRTCGTCRYCTRTGAAVQRTPLADVRESGMSIYLMSMVWNAGPDSASQRLMMLALADHANDEGTQCYPSVARLAEKCCVKERRAQRILHDLEVDGWLTRDTTGGKGRTSNYVLNLARLQAAAAERVHIAADSDSERVHSSTSKGALSDTKGALSGSKGCTPVHPNHQEPSDKATTRETLTLVGEIVPVSVADGFESFWALYPRKVGKGQARRAWDAAVKKCPGAEIIAGLERCRQQLVSVAEAKFIPHPSTWLNGERWSDEPDPSVRGEMASQFDRLFGGSGGSAVAEVERGVYDGYIG